LGSVRTRSIIASIIIVISLIFLFPNFTSKKLDVFFSKKYKPLKVEKLSKKKKTEKKSPKKEKGKPSPSQKWIKVSDDDVKKWVDLVKSKYTREGSIQVSREDLIPDWPKNRHYVLEGRFLTSAYMNKITQADQKLSRIIDKQRTRIRKEGLEKSMGLTPIRLGLDLQGGLAIQIQGDFAGYLKEIQKRYPASLLKEWDDELADPTNTSEKKDEIEAKINNANNELVLEDWEVFDHLNHTKLLLESRLSSGLKIQEATIKIIADARSLEISIPGVANAEEIKEFLTQTDTVSYHLNHKDYQNLLKKVAYKFNEFRKTPPDERKAFIETLEEENGFIEKGAMLRAYYVRSEYQKRKYREKTKKKRNPIVPIIEDYDKTLVPEYFMVLERKASLAGDDIKSANSVYDTDSLQRIVSFELTDLGSDKFFDVTKNNRGRLLSIVIGDKIRSAPRINDPITGGRAQITGSFTAREARDISRIMKEGALPIPLKVIRERNIGATLGEETIEMGFRAVLFGFLAVIVFMFIYYQLGGVVANTALILNLFLLGGLLSVGKVTLTLPGFAGIILTLGMAVDTNVIIFERIKEELATGKSIRHSIDLGFSRALWTILDANVTTMLAGIILIQLGEGPIKGFAVTLCMGIISSLLTGLFMSRIIFDFMASRKIKKLPLGFKKTISYELQEGKL
jgi:preprotein translocase subunit SecD